MAKISHQVSIPDTASGQRLDAALAKLLPEYSRERLKSWIKRGAVTVDGKVLRPKDPVQEGQVVCLEAELTESTLAPQDIDLDIVFEDDALLVINKPAGLVVHPGAGNPDQTLVNALLHHDPNLTTLPRAGIIHRLDKDTTGLLVIAKTLPAHTQLVSDMQNRDIERIYHCLVVGELTCGGTVDAPLGRHPRQRTKMAVVNSGKAAVSHYRILKRFAGMTYLEVQLESGRTHQIRVHMAHIKHPVLGDSTYGGTQRIKRSLYDEPALNAIDQLNRQALHANTLRLTHPLTGERMTFSAPLPNEITTLLETLPHI